MDFIIVFGVGIIFYICAILIWKGDSEIPQRNVKRLPSYRADELSELPHTEDVQIYQDNVCVKCPYFDGYDMCLYREHWGSVIQNTIEYCKRRKENEEKVHNTENNL